MSKARPLIDFAAEQARTFEAPDGIQPTPFERAYPMRGGSSDDFIAGTSKSVSNRSEYATDWVIKFKPSSDALVQVATGEGFDVFGALNVQYDGDQFLEYQPISNPNQSPLQLPLVGKCFQVHGRFITWRIVRTAGTRPLKLEWAIVPGRVGLWFVSFSGQSTIAQPVNIPIPAFATRFQVLADFTPGDSYQQMNASGAGVLLTIPASPQTLNQLQPIDPNAAFIRYSTVAPGQKSFLVGFEVIS